MNRGFALTIYDVTGIQDYIFRSKQLKDNVGASNLVEKVTDEFLIEAIKEKTKNSRTDWENYSNFELLSNLDIEAEIIYTGGGNALVAYKNKDIAKEVTKELSRIVLHKALSLQFIAVTIEVEGLNFQEDRQKLFQALVEKKNAFVKTNKLIGISINRLCSNTRLPVTDKYKQEYIPRETFLKRKASQTELPILNDMYKQTLDFDKLGREDGESHIAVVHIDGNSMGQTFKNIINNVSDYSIAIQKIREVSKQINDSYKQTFEELLKGIIDSIDNEGKLGPIKLIKEDDKIILPIRKIVLNGDDVTFVCDGRIALSSADFFLEKINQKKLLIEDEQIPLSACAGIAIVKSHYPFYRAYQLAEELTKLAKEKAKTYREDNREEFVKSWIDFQVVNSGATTNSIVDMRKKYYITPNNEELCWRPWLITNEVTETETKIIHSFNIFKEIYKKFVEGDKKNGIEKWPRSKLKQLRDTYFLGASDTELLLEQYKSRGLSLDVIFLNQNGFTHSKKTPVFDVLEMLDLFTELKNEQIKEDYHEDKD